MQSLSITNGLSYTGSLFIKKGELTSIILQSNSSSRWVASATFDVENGVVTSGTWEIEEYGNGWYRCSISGNAVQTTTAAGLEMYTSTGAGRDGDGLQGAATSSGNILPNGTRNSLSFDRGDALSDFSGKTKEIAYYNEILTDLELETRTSYRSLNEMVTELNLNAL